MQLERADTHQPWALWASSLLITAHEIDTTLGVETFSAVATAVVGSGRSRVGSVPGS